jgi:outer membrane protein assembly factor BamE (lipoprotein component of BamABCDE complex)
VNTIFLVAVSLLICFICSCTTAGRQIDAEQVRQNIVADKSTRNDVLRVCGEPLSIESGLKSGNETWHYAYIQKNVTPLGLLTNRLGVGTEWKSDRTVVDVYLENNIVKDVKIDTGTTIRMNNR